MSQRRLIGNVAILTRLDQRMNAVMVEAPSAALCLWTGI